MISRTLALFFLELLRIVARAVDRWAARRFDAPRSLVDERYTPAGRIPPPPGFEPTKKTRRTASCCFGCARYWRDLDEVPGAVFVHFYVPRARQ